MSVPTKIPKELQAPRRRNSAARCHIGELHATEVTTDMACRCPHIDAFLPKYLDSGSLGLGNNRPVHTGQGSKRIKRLTISDLHFSSILSKPASKYHVNKPIIGKTVVETLDKPIYAFGEEETKMNYIMSGGEGSYAPFFPSTFVQQVHKERDFERMLCVEIAKTNGKNIERAEHEGHSLLHTKNTQKTYIKVKDASHEFISKSTTSDSSDMKNSAEMRSLNINRLESNGPNGRKRQLKEKDCLDLKSLIRMRDQREVDVHAAELKVEQWLEVIRQNRLSYWNRDDMNCSSCVKKSKPGKLKSCLPCGDSLMQCLDCSLIGCGSILTSSDGSSKRHLQQHFLLSNHNFAITCGERGEIYCMKCGDFVYCEVFDSEKERVEINVHLPCFQWDRRRKLQRSFAFREEGDDFYVVPNHCDDGSIHHQSITAIWKGFQATYPQDVSNNFILAGQRTLDRLQLFKGDITKSRFMNACSTTADIVYRQCKRKGQYWKIDCPVGIYNAGNICYISSVIQCIFNLRPIQQFFLRDAKHDCRACEILRSSNNDSSAVNLCLVCEIDRLILTYYGSSQGLDLGVIMNSTDFSGQAFQVQSELNSSGGAVNNLENSDYVKFAVSSIEQGMPIVISDFLAIAWKMKEMALLAGNEQHDAHEFMQVFLDIIDRDCMRFEKNITAARKDAECKQVKSTVLSTGKEALFPGSVTSIFSGSFRSVLMCNTCGFKRSSSEPFLNVSLSLPLGKVADATRRTFKNGDNDNIGSSRKRGHKLDVRTCEYLNSYLYIFSCKSYQFAAHPIPV
jgi:hypothetical protein